MAAITAIGKSILKAIDSCKDKSHYFSIAATCLLETKVVRSSITSLVRSSYIKTDSSIHYTTVDGKSLNLSIYVLTEKGRKLLYDLENSAPIEAVKAEPSIPKKEPIFTQCPKPVYKEYIPEKSNDRNYVARRIRGMN